MLGKQYWIEQLGEKWALNLKGVLNTPYMEKLVNYINIEYALKTIYPSNLTTIFNTFKECPWDDVKVVIIGKEPGFNVGIFPELHSDSYIDSIHNGSLYNIARCVEEEYYNGLNLDFDYSLSSWNKQGVLFLNKALTVQSNKSGSHLAPWKKFHDAVIASIVEYKPGTIFFLWGEEAQEHADKLNNQHVFSWECPHVASIERRDWKCPNFKQADKLMISLYGENQIQW